MRVQSLGLQRRAPDTLGHVRIELCQNILHYPLERSLICIHTHADAKVPAPPFEKKACALRGAAEAGLLLPV